MTDVEAIKEMGLRDKETLDKYLTANNITQDNAINVMKLLVALSPVKPVTEEALVQYHTATSLIQKYFAKRALELKWGLL